MFAPPGPGTPGTAGVEFPSLDLTRSFAGGPTDVGTHPAGASPFGVQDMMYNVFQYTDEYCSEHSCWSMVRGGSRYSPHHVVFYYFPRCDTMSGHHTPLLCSRPWMA